jgi:MFS family permease
VTNPVTSLPRQSITRKALRISTVEGSWATLHFALTSGAFFTGFALLIGANDFQLGWLAAIPLLSQVFQLPGAYLVEKTGLRRPVVAWFSVVSRTLWLPIALIPLMCADHRIRMFGILYLAACVSMSFAVSPWIAWMSHLVPPSIRGRYFGTRNRIAAIVGAVAAWVGGVAIDAFEHRGYETSGYLALFLVAVIAGLAAFRLILRQPDPGYRAEQMPPLKAYLLQPVRDRNFRRILAFYLYWWFSVNIAAPFFNAHLLKHMEWSYQSIQLLGIVVAVVSILCQKMWGRLVDRFGHKPVLTICAIGIIQLPFYYAFCPWDVRWPIYVNALFTGLFWGGFGLASFNQMIAALPPNRRTMYVAVLSALTGITNFVATILSGWLAEQWEGLRWQIGSLTVVNYQVLFVITGLLRIPGLLFLRRIQEPHARGTRYVIRKMFEELIEQRGPGW